MSELTSYFVPLARWWRHAPATQRATTVVALGASLGIAWGIAVWSGRPDYTLLYANLEERDQGAIVAKLQETKVPYRVGEGGVIEVPASQAPEVRMQLASAGLPKGGSVGYEIFDQNRLGVSEFQEKLNYRRALQGELERTIGRLAAVERVRVHLALPERALFGEQQEKASASVTLDLRAGAELGKEEVKAITHLVASSVPGLDRENVTLVDSDGDLLSAPEEALGANPALASRLEAQTEVEQRLQRELQTVLDRLVGPGKSLVRVAAELDLDQRQAQEERYQPQGVIEAQRENRETYHGSRQIAKGVPGKKLTSSPTPVGGARPEGYERTESDAKYRVSKRVEFVTNSPGMIKRLSVAALIDETAPITSEGKLREAIAAAAGVDEARGDRVVVQRVPFAKPAEEDGGTLPGRVVAWYRQSGGTVTALALLLVFGLLARGLMKAQAPVAPEPAVGQRLSLTSSDAAGPLSLPAPAEDAGLSDLDAARAAQVIRGWLTRKEG